MTVEALSKAYRLGQVDGTPDTLFGAVRHWAAAPLRGLRNLRRLDTRGANAQAAEDDLFWALRDVSFEVNEGDVVGIVGRNGAGKSTLLKVLSRITEPTSGGAVIEGRVSSLLEVGTGFHPELSGRENVYMNGTLLGMSKAEIDRKFEAIVEFAGVSRFLDTPTKRYSSGMQVRLAFAVAAHLEPEILIIDEVLAVGDAEFQKKCLGKMRSVASSGRTVLFVSHNMESISRLCSRAMTLHEGRLIVDGSVEQAIDAYLQNVAQPQRQWPAAGSGAAEANGSAPGNEVVRLRSVQILDPQGQVRGEHRIQAAVRVEIEYEVFTAGHTLVPNFHFFTADGTCIFVGHDLDPKWNSTPRPPGRYRTHVELPADFLNEGEVSVGIAMSSYHPFTVHFYERDTVGFRVIEPEPGVARGPYAGHVPGVIRPALQWRTESLSE